MNTLYEQAINALTPRAAAAADVEILKANYKNPEDWAAAWNRRYHLEMNILTHEAGLRRSTTMPRHQFTVVATIKTTVEVFGSETDDEARVKAYDEFCSGEYEVLSFAAEKA